uniref:Uncharacterized protein n=1 Tax=Glossina brevipalpis TaxID=37001 RepID=A0A1A9W757_9MUSC
MKIERRPSIHDSKSPSPEKQQTGLTSDEPDDDCDNNEYLDKTPNNDQSKKSFTEKFMNIINHTEFRQESLLPLRNNTTIQNNNNIYVGVIVMVFGMVAYSISSQTTTTQTTTTQTAKIACNYQDLEREYNHLNSDVWTSLQCGTENILNKVSHKSANYLFIYNKNKTNEVQHMVKKIAQRTSKCFNDSQELIEMNATYFNSKEVIEDYGKIIEWCKKKIEDSNVILIGNLNEVPAEAAESLHVICDTENPIRKDLVVFLTLEVPVIKNEEEVQAITEETLNKMWGPKLPDPILQPLITRVTDSVMNV